MATMFSLREFIDRLKGLVWLDYRRQQVGTKSGTVRVPSSRASYSISGTEHINLCNWVKILRD